MNKSSSQKHISKILLTVLLINIAIIACTLYIFTSHLRENDDAATILKINSMLKDMIIADKFHNATEKLLELQKRYEKLNYHIQFKRKRPKGSLIYTREGLIFDPDIDAFVRRVRATDCISISTFLHKQKRWINIEAPKKIYLPQDKTALLLFYGIPLPVLSFILVLSIYTMMRKKIFIQDLKTSLSSDTPENEDYQESKVILDLKASIKQLIDEKILLQSSIAHDINTCIFRLRLKLAKFKNKDPSITQELNFLNDIVKSSMVLAKYEKSTIPLEHFDLVALLEKFSEDFYENNEQVNFKLPDTFIPIKANSKLINRVMHNLIDNATKYATQVVTTVKTKNGFVYLICKDNGKGIAEDEIKQLLLPFEQKNKQNLGIGLGLAIINKIVKIQQAEFFLRNSKHGPGLLAIVRFKIVH